jgi:hypothetical protein
MAKAERPKSRLKSKPKFSDKAQSERFIEAARTLHVDNINETFDKALSIILSRKTVHSKDRMS